MGIVAQISKERHEILVQILVANSFVFIQCLKYCAALSFLVESSEVFLSSQPISVKLTKNIKLNFVQMEKKLIRLLKKVKVT